MGPTQPADRCRAAVTGVWAALSVAAAGLVLACGTNVPVVDEWATLPLLAAPRPCPALLWERHNEHFLPLPRLVYWAAFRLTGDLRAGMLLSAIGWSALAYLLIRTARAVRGGPAYADVFFPVVLLNWSQSENLLMSYQVGFLCSTGLAGLTLRELALGPPTTGRLLRVGVYTALLPLCGGHGLILATAGMAWLTAAAVLGRKDWHRVLLCGALLGLAAAAAAPYAGPASPGPEWQPAVSAKAFVIGLLGFGSVGYGLAGWYLWPGLAVVPAAVAVGGGSIVARGWFSHQPADRPALFGLTAFAAAVALLAASIAWGRGRYGAFAVFFPRYTAFSALLPVALFFLGLKFGGPRLSRAVPAALAAVALALLPLNTRLGWADGRRLRDVQQSAEADLRAGVPVEVVAERTNFLTFNDPALWAGLVEDYARRGLGRLDRVAHLPPVRVEPVGGISAAGDGWFSATLPEPRRCLAVRVRVRYRDRDPHRPARFRLAWQADRDGPEHRRDDWLFRGPTAGGDPAMVVWIDGRVSRFRFQPDADTSGGAAVTRVELIAPAADGPDLKATASTGKGAGR